MKYIDSEKLIAEIERQQRRLVLLSNTEQVDMRRDCALQNGVYNHILEIITSLQQEQPMPNSTELIAKWEEEKDVLKQMDFRGDEWRLAQNAFMDGVGIGLSVRQEQPLTIEKVVGQCKKFGGNPEVIPHGKKCVFGNVPSEDICQFCGVFCESRVPEIKTIASTGIPDINKASKQPEVDLEKEIIRYQREDMDRDTTVRDVARHFYELGLNARKED